ncbi:MAG TPA: hypothetical protein VHU83_17285 [Bryobacteraceae bacterium]|jgi:hypothetical protein|nr:hypothetical protein [Bryobacteraceae bacterium]
MTRLTARSSTIFIATGGATHVYRSVNEIPPALRRKLQDSTRGMNSATILIADKRGQQELVRALQGRPTDVHRRLAEIVSPPDTAELPLATPQSPNVSSPWRKWLEILLPIALGASLWFFIDSRF